jgi:hypothetical protein
LNFAAAKLAYLINLALLKLTPLLNLTPPKLPTLLNIAPFRDRRNKKISNRRDNFEYCIFLINTNFHDEAFSDATFYGAIFNKAPIHISPKSPICVVQDFGASLVIRYS